MAGRPAGLASREPGAGPYHFRTGAGVGLPDGRTPASHRAAGARLRSGPAALGTHGGRRQVAQRGTSAAEESAGPALRRTLRPGSFPTGTARHDHPRGRRRAGTQRPRTGDRPSRRPRTYQQGDRQGLFVSSKTVEYHLSHVYEKLALTNRRELRDHVQRGILTQGN
ncbi:LuxR C-terminal-related transcriptional regulator [Streptomyces griseofuscus]|uniref:LuxR C-terminal-related transcriptional regulator n=1 Tax=Streptomyces griseofuscus TaxID=146922 RepID=UPI003796778B